jgi:hypothetical protein
VLDERVDYIEKVIDRQKDKDVIMIRRSDAEWAMKYIHQLGLDNIKTRNILGEINETTSKWFEGVMSEYMKNEREKRKKKIEGEQS